MEDKLHCVILDDEAKDRENLRILLQKFCPEVSILGEAEEFDAFKKLVEDTKPDVAFVDIQLGNYNVFNLLEKITLNFTIVFVTAYDQYALKGYKFNAADYLLKPIKRVELKNITDKLYLQKLTRTKQENQLGDKQNFYTKISLSDAQGVYILEIDDIVYCKSSGNYTEFVLLTKPKITISKNLKHFGEKLTEYGFFRVHKSYLINLENLNYISKSDGLYAFMKNEEAVPISSNCKKDLFDRMKIL